VAVGSHGNEKARPRIPREIGQGVVDGAFEGAALGVGQTGGRTGGGGARRGFSWTCTTAAAVVRTVIIRRLQRF
jgi:hypothetical protein